jgi:hypothetical protein
VLVFSRLGKRGEGKSEECFERWAKQSSEAYVVHETRFPIYNMDITIMGILHIFPTSSCIIVLISKSSNLH